MLHRCLSCAIRRAAGCGKGTLRMSRTFSSNVLTDQSNQTEEPHVSVFLQRLVDVLNPADGQVFVDMTFGGGGHTKRLLDIAPHCTVFCLDRDPVAYKMATELSKTLPQIVPLKGKFSDIHVLLHKHGVRMGEVDGIMFDCGTSNMQFDNRERGFALSKDSALNMRMDGPDRDPDQVSAADVVNHMSENGLYQIIKKYGEETYARVIARGIVDSRDAFGRIETTKQLAQIVSQSVGVSHRSDSLQRQQHSATKTFQAIRIFVNNELNEIHNGIEVAWHLLRVGGVCGAISFHSLEDRIIKRHFHGIDMDERFNMGHSANFRENKTDFSEDEIAVFASKRWEPLSKKVLKPDEEEISVNPRARSAKLRAARKIVPVV